MGDRNDGRKPPKRRHTDGEVFGRKLDDPAPDFPSLPLDLHGKVRGGNQLKPALIKASADNSQAKKEGKKDGKKGGKATPPARPIGRADQVPVRPAKPVGEFGR